jgi:DNA polymerase IV
MRSSEWAEEPDGTEWPRAVIHVDLDAFYASVEQLRNPELRGKPVIVGGGRDREGNAVVRRGVVSAASYEVREFGVHSAMPLITALRLCPQAIVVPVDFPAYREASRQVFDILGTVTPQIEPASLDEGYLDVTGSIRRFGSPVEMARGLRAQIKAAVGLNASFGIATGKTVAKVASDFDKPRGFVVVPPGSEREFLAPLPLRALPGLGPATENSLRGLGITTLGELAALPADTLERRLGKHAGQSLLMRARGIDRSEVSLPALPKSVSREETFGHDVTDTASLHERIRVLAADVGGRLRHDRLTGRTVNLKIKYEDFTTVSRRQSLAAGTDSDTAIAQTATGLFAASWSGRPVRLLGVGVSTIEERAQMDLFTPVPEESVVDRAMDELRTRFGNDAVRRGVGGSLRDLDFRGSDLRRLKKPE